RQGVGGVADDVRQAAGATHAAARGVALEPGVLELAAAVGTTHAGAGGGGRVVHDDVAGPGEADDDHQVAVGGVDRRPGELAGTEGDRGDDGDARPDEALDASQRAEAGDEAVAGAAGGVGGVEGPVARAV